MSKVLMQKLGAEIQLTDISDPIIQTDTIESPVDRYQKPFRLLSATVIPGHFLDISEAVLQDTLPMFENLIVHVNHWEYDLAQWLGKVTNVKWEAAAVVDGRVVPAGVNGLVNILRSRDEKLGGDIILGLQEGVIRHGSVTMHFNWKKSHPNLDDWQFEEMLGKEVEGSIVRRIITKITMLKAWSLVHLGADPDAIARVALEHKNNNSNQKEVDMTGEQLKAKLGLAPTATDGEVETALTAKLAQASKYEASLKVLQEKAKANIALLSAAKVEVNPFLVQMTDSLDEGALGFVNTELEKQVALALPPAGRSSEQILPKDDDKNKKPLSPDGL